MNTDEIIETAIQGHSSTRDAIRWAIQQEREACAKVCEELLSIVSTGDEHMDGVWDCIAEIRSRGEK